MNPESAAPPKALSQESTLLDWIRPLLVHHRFDHAASEFLTRLADGLGCERASLGFIRGHTLQLAAVSSHYQTLKRPALPEVIAAMQESLLQEISLLYPHPPSDFPPITVAHKELIRHHHLTGALTIPLAHEGQLIGALTLEGRQDPPLDTQTLHWLEQLTADIGPMLHHQWTQQQPFITRTLTTIRQQLFGPKTESASRLRFAVGVSLGVLLLLLFLLPLPHRVTGQARLEASVQRVISAPIDSYLKEVRVRPGDPVKANQVLAELNDDTLQIQQRRLQADAQQQENAMAEAMVKADRTQVATTRAKLDDLLAQKELIEQQLEHTKLTAPFDGIVIKGDLSQLLGTPLKRSDPLLTLSQGQGFRVMVDINERDIAELQPEQRGALVLAAQPEERYAIRIVRMTPVATITTEGKNIFEIEAVLDGSTLQQKEKLAPGLKGIAKIDTGHRPVGWVWLQRAWHGLSYAFWSYLG